MERTASREAWTVALAGALALAVAMGIGRFAFTPIMPMMQHDGSLTLVEGSALASANYLGYLAGALVAMRLHVRHVTAIGGALLVIAITTVLMGLSASFIAWLVLRTVAGAASALVLVHVSAWTLVRLAAARRPSLGGVVYGGVGAGIAFAGLACFALLGARRTGDDAWLLLGAIAALALVLVWPALRAKSNDDAGNDGNAASRAGASVASAATHRTRRGPRLMRLVVCYGAFGLGYIIPATFLPAMARQALGNSPAFGWAWPAFGFAAVLSTLAAGPLTRAYGAQRVWMAANIVMAVGLVAPIVMPGLAGIIVAACCVGGTFMVITMAGLQEARRIAGADARSALGAMTAAFALGQVLGPLVVAALAPLPHGFDLGLWLSALVLVAASVGLHLGRERASANAAIGHGRTRA